jgi:glycosyltransferase involved in cell wall biosynthesis/Flp pilus assembly protein TadD
MLWDGPFFNTTGYAAHSRYLMRALVEGGLSVQLSARDDVPAVRAQMLSPEAPDAACWHRLLRRVTRRDVHVSFYTPTDWSGASVFRSRREEHPGYRAYVGLTHFECEPLPTGWAEACAELDELWVPTRFVRDLFVGAGLPADRIHVLPTGIDATRFDPDRVAALPIPQRRGFVFLATFDWSLRKGWDVLIRAYARAFTATDDVCLVLRASSRRKENVMAEIDGMLASIGRTRDDLPPIILLPDALTDAEMAQLYQAADVFVLPTRGEGLGLPYMEAMASGVPVIATRWSGHVDFVSEDVGWLIDVDAVVPVDEAQAARSPFYRTSQRWAQPSLSHTAALMRHAFEHPQEVRRKGAAAREAIVSTWFPERTARWVRERLEALAPDADAALERGRRAEAAGRHDRALDAYVAAAQGRRGWHPPVYNRASLLARLGKRAHARRLFESIVDTPDAGLRAGVRFHLGELAMHDGCSEEAVSHFRACLAATPHHDAAEAWLALIDARAEEQAGRLEQAIAAYERACGHRPTWALARYNLASALSRAGREDHALTEFERVADEASTEDLRGGSHFHLARLLIARDDLEGARRHVAAALREVPDHAGARELHASLAARA